MSQSSILSLASTAAVAIATLAAQPADAGFRPIMGHLPAFGPVGHAGPPIHIPIAAGPSHPIVPIHVRSARSISRRLIRAIPSDLFTCLPFR